MAELPVTKVGTLDKKALRDLLDLLLTPGWAFHGHQNVSDAPMAA